MTTQTITISETATTAGLMAQVRRRRQRRPRVAGTPRTPHVLTTALQHEVQRHVLARL